MNTNEQQPPSSQELSPMAKKVPKVLSEAVQSLIKRIEGIGTPEEKIRIALDFMKNSLSHTGTPRFKDFWDVRAHCLPLFKTTMNQAQRAELWSAYVEISMEARRLKEILDEQAAFAAEQIELAITSLEKDLSNYEHLIMQVDLPQMVEKSTALKNKQTLYQGLQRELNLLNALSARVNSLRKEVIKTDMRVKIRAKFFDRLSVLGDQIFPRRKELIKTISEQFVIDIEQFVKDYFGDEESRTGTPYYLLREEIKVLQGIAKGLTLSTHAFNTTRQQLSQCWDRLREWDKKRKEELSQKKQASQENVSVVKEKIAAMAQTLQESQMTLAKANEEAKTLYEFMRSVDLSREDVVALKNEVRDLIQPFVDQERAAEQERHKEVQDREQRKKETIQNLLDQFQKLETLMETSAIEEVLEKKAQIEEAFAKEAPGKVERMRFDALQRRARDLIADKKASKLLNLSESDAEALEQLKAALNERITMRDEIRATLENYRKSLGSSGFDFEKAMSIREMIDTDKQRLAKLNVSIQELEEKIDELGG